MSTQILLIEDNENNRYLETFLLEKHGYTVTHAADAKAALARAAHQRFDLILLDIQLPGMDGYTLARSLRATAALADTPIVAVTSYAMTGDREKALQAGCTGYIEKPIDPQTFVMDVARHLPGDAQ